MAIFNPDAYRSVEQIAQASGFATESHTIITSDGYALTLFRIPGALGESSVKKPAILLMHAQDADMKEWIINDSDKSIAFILVRAGFDVWLGNNRGSSYGLAHTSLNRKEKEFWNFY